MVYSDWYARELSFFVENPSKPFTEGFAICCYLFGKESCILSITKVVEQGHGCVCLAPHPRGQTPSPRPCHLTDGESFLHPAGLQSYHPCLSSLYTENKRIYFCTSLSFLEGRGGWLEVTSCYKSFYFLCAHLYLKVPWNLQSGRIDA